MLESRPLKWVVLALTLTLAAAPAVASDPVEDLGVTAALAKAREFAADAVPETGTEYDALIQDVLDPQDPPADVNDAREEAAEHAPETGTPADESVQEALDPEGDPDADQVIAVAYAAVATVNDLVETVRDSLPDDDPIAFVTRQVDPIAGSASAALGSGDDYETEGIDPASGSATLVSQATTQLIMAGASAAAAAVLVSLWLAGSSGSLGAAGAGTATSSGELRRLLPFASPLFTRFEKDTVLGHPKREALYAAILQDPGISLQALCDASNLSRTAATHHLRLLEMQHLIVSKRMGRSRHYYENGGRFGRDQKDAYAVLHNARSKDVARFVRDNPGAIQKQLCDALGIQPSIAHWHLNRLQAAQLVEAVRNGRTVAYFPGTALKSLDRPAIPAAPEPAPQPELVVPVMRALPA